MLLTKVCAPAEAACVSIDSEICSWCVYGIQEEGTAVRLFQENLPPKLIVTALGRHLHAILRLCFLVVPLQIPQATSERPTRYHHTEGEGELAQECFEKTVRGVVGSQQLLQKILDLS